MNFLSTAGKRLLGLLVVGYFTALLAVPAVFLGFLGLGSVLSCL